VLDQAPDFDKIAKVGADAWHNAEYAFNELLMLVLDELSRRSGNLVMMCRVTDVAGREGALAKSMLPNPMAAASEKQFKSTGSAMKAAYPTVTFKWFMVNLRASYKANTQSVITKFGGRSAYKMIVLDDKFQQTLHADIDPSQLSTTLGGAFQR